VSNYCGLLKKKNAVLSIVLCMTLLLGCSKTKTPTMNHIALSETVNSIAKINVVIFYDDDPSNAWNYGKLYVNMVRNLLGQFATDVSIVDAAAYKKGMLEQYDAGIYIGNIYDYPLSDDFLDDVIHSGRSFLWLNSDIKQLFKKKEWGAEEKLGFTFVKSGMLNAGATILYKGKELPCLDSDNYFNFVKIEDNTQCKELATLQSEDASKQPYAIRCGNFFYLANNPMANFYMSYLVFADLLHDLLETNIVESHRALVRLEDLLPGNTNYAKVKELVDFLYNKGIPFTFGVIPVNTDPTGGCR